MGINNLYEKEIITIILYTSLFFIILAAGLILFFFFSRKKIIQKELEKKNLEIQYQREQLRAILITQETERKRIAQDLHDDISSKLNVVSLNSHLLNKKNLTSDETFEISTNIIELTAKALQSTRRIAHDLLPPVLDRFGLDAGLDELCSEYNATNSVIVTYKNTIAFEDMAKDKSLHLFRIVQELINNSIRHGKAKSIAISFEMIDGSKICNYTDDGVGFDTNDIRNQNGLGMKNIQSRVDFLNGSITIKSTYNKGVAIILHF
ncbi:MAG: sensor histidine kinase [Flavobacteriaceae bacterium]|jgi:signal transduction histidine kinase|uniref:histidine kinase n=1 Tax=Flavobacterium kayseriense TaxID=2764714 RepID=A0ABR7J2Y1_9FLAO|nr:sensor histidine kinase [Flavobacterium kayseriense]MBC5839792.1 sensor histidine kinase [Flavobacterium kayseriense]MBC5847538.1 sensor histidine kinase [Flavobacterium kayseriense]MBU0940196.1 sensor histidine kinase [Bacteroidota bacterium]MBX9889560.1 sensor histidine kinase [Flavobacteriaceae bacterium]